MFQIHNKVPQLHTHTQFWGLFSTIGYYQLLTVAPRPRTSIFNHWLLIQPVTQAIHIWKPPPMPYLAHTHRETAGDQKRRKRSHAHQLGVCRDFHIHKIKYYTAVIKGPVEKRSMNSLHLLISNRDGKTHKETQKAVSGVSFTKRVTM